MFWFPVLSPACSSPQPWIRPSLALDLILCPETFSSTLLRPSPAPVFGFHLSLSLVLHLPDPLNPCLFGSWPIAWTYHKLYTILYCPLLAVYFITSLLLVPLSAFLTTDMSPSSPVLEWIPTRVRTVVGTGSGYVYTIGQLLLAGMAYFIRDWRWLTLAVSLPYFVAFLYSWWDSENVLEGGGGAAEQYQMGILYLVCFTIIIIIIIVVTCHSAYNSFM